MMRSKDAFSIVELVVSVAIFSIIAVTAFSCMSAVKEQYAIQDQEAAIDLREIMKQEFLLQGVQSSVFQNPLAEHGDVSAQLARSESDLSTFGKNKIACLSANFETERDRVNVLGKLISDSGEAIPFKESELLPPTVNYAGEIDLNSFPLVDFISAANNPLGTYYRYTFDGNEPSPSSPIWNFSPLSLLNWAPIIKIRAFNEDPRYLPSKVAIANLTLASKLGLKREDGSDNLAVTYQEVTQGINRFVVLGGIKDDTAKIRYSVNGGQKVDHKQSFHIPLKEWTAAGVTLTLEIELKNSNWEGKVVSQDYQLTIKKEKLAMPELKTLDPSFLKKGDMMQIVTDRGIAKTLTKIEGGFGPYDDFAETIAIN